MPDVRREPFPVRQVDRRRRACGNRLDGTPLAQAFVREQAAQGGRVFVYGNSARMHAGLLPSGGGGSRGARSEVRNSSHGAEG